MIRIGKHSHHAFLHLFRGIGQIDAVAERLAHLSLSIRSRESEARRIRRQQNLRNYKSLTINGVEFVHNFPCLLDHRLLVFSCRHRGGLESRYVGSLADRIGEESHWYALLVLVVVLGRIVRETPHQNLRFYGRIPLEPLHCHKVHIIERKFAELWNLRLDENCHFFRIVCIVGKCLSVSNHYENLLEFT